MPRLLRLSVLAAVLATPVLGQDSRELTVLSYNVWYGGVQVDFYQTIAVLRAADADIVGLQEPDGQTLRIAQAAGYSYVDLRRHIISRFPLFDSGLGSRTETGPAPYSLAGLDSDAVHAWALVGPGQVVAVANVHLTSDPYGPSAVQAGVSFEEVLALEDDTRGPEVWPFADALSRVAVVGTPLFVTGDFNSPSHLDWTAEAAAVRGLPYAMPWPVTTAMEDAGLTDSFRAVHPDPVARPGFTYSPGFPHPAQQDGEVFDRIDYVWSANATPVASVLLGEAGNPDVDIALTPWPSDHRAVLSTFTVVPMTAPALIAVEPRLVTEGDSFLVRVNMPDRADWSVAIVPRDGDPASQAITGAEGILTYWQTALRLSTLGLTAGAYDAVLLDIDGIEQVRTRFSVVAPGTGTTLDVASPQVPLGGPITARWTGAPGMRFDWIGLYARNEPSVYNYLAFAYTGATLEGEITLTPEDFYEDLGPGAYELRLLADDHYAVLAVAPFDLVSP